MKLLPRIKSWQSADIPKDGSPWVCDCRSYDIPETIVKLIKSCPLGLVAVALSPLGGPKMIAAAERTARRRGIRILWFTKMFE